MPQNMQKKPKVAQLDVEEELQLEDDMIYDDLPAVDVEVMSEEDPRYLATLKLLQHGYTPKKITDHLLKKEIMDSRPAASRLALRVMKENPQEQRTNAYIQFGVAAFVAFIALLFIVPSILASGTLQFSPAYVLFLVSGWFVYKGYQTLSRFGAKKK